MKTKRKIGKKIPVLKAIEGKVPVAWEKSKAIPDIPYSCCNQIEDYNFGEDNIYKVEYKISEEEHILWDSIGYIEETVFGHATLQNVDFEWGKNSRPYRYQPQVNVCKNVNELKIVKNGKESEIVFETATEFETLEIKKCKIKTKKTGKKSKTNNSKEERSFYEKPVNSMNETAETNDHKFEDCATKKTCLIPYKGALLFIKYKILEEQQVVFGLEIEIPEIEYEHALVQDVKFEYGSWGRSVRIKPDVRGQEVEQQKVKFAEKIEVVFEVVQPFHTVNFERCKIIQKDFVRTLYLEVKECKKEKGSPNIIYKNSKFYCKSCNEHICNACFTTECMDHNVQWLGNATFRCESTYHKPS